MWRSPPVKTSPPSLPHNQMVKQEAAGKAGQTSRGLYNVTGYSDWILDCGKCFRFLLRRFRHGIGFSRQQNRVLIPQAKGKESRGASNRFWIHMMDIEKAFCLGFCWTSCTFHWPAPIWNANPLIKKITLVPLVSSYSVQSFFHIPAESQGAHVPS